MNDMCRQVHVIGGILGSTGSTDSGIGVGRPIFASGIISAACLAELSYVALVTTCRCIV